MDFGRYEEDALDGSGGEGLSGEGVDVHVEEVCGIATIDSSVLETPWIVIYIESRQKSEVRNLV